MDARVKPAYHDFYGITDEETLLDIRPYFRYIPASNLAHVKDVSRRRRLIGASAVFKLWLDSRAANRGGAPGGAARPKQAVRASGSFCGARRARSASEW